MSGLWRGVSMLFGGSFDPIHLGHLAVANAAQHQCAPSDFIWMPAAQAPLKSRPPMSGEQRWELLEAVVGERTGERCSKLELQRGGTSFTGETLSELRNQNPEQRWQLLMGWDSFCSLDQWRNADEWTSGIQVVVAPRHGGLGSQFVEQAQRLKSVLTQLDAHLLDMREAVVSSTQVRQALAVHDYEQAAALLPKVVWQRLTANGTKGRLD